MRFGNIISKLGALLHPSFDPDMKVSLHPALGINKKETTESNPCRFESQKKGFFL
jgi:hypothetical protein